MRGRFGSVGCSRASYPGEPEVIGLLALMLLIDSRRAARLGANGEMILLRIRTAPSEHALIAEGQSLVRQCLNGTGQAPTRFWRRSTPCIATRLARRRPTGARLSSSTTS